MSLSPSNSIPQDETFEPKPIKDVSQSLDELDTEDLYTKYKVSGSYSQSPSTPLTTPSSSPTETTKDARVPGGAGGVH